MEYLKPEYLKKIFSNKRNLIIIGVVTIVIIGLVAFLIYRSKKCSSGVIVEKTYEIKLMAVDEWRKYNDPEVKFFFEDTTQKFLTEKINALKGYGGLSYVRTDNSLSVDRDYLIGSCRPIRYKYEMTINASILGSDLSAALLGRWYYKDLYKMKAIYNPGTSQWEDFNITLVEPKLVPGSAVDLALINAKKEDNFQEIKKQNYQISEIYWQAKNKDLTNDVVVLIYSKPVKEEENCFDYYTIKIDNFANMVIFGNREKKCQ